MNAPKPKHPPVLWTPTDAQLIEMRRRNRKGETRGQIYAAINPPVTLDTFYKTMRRYGINSQPVRKI